MTFYSLILEGERAGELIPLACKWFISSMDGKLKEIDGLVGNAYQPCAEDVGSRYSNSIMDLIYFRVSVQATPVLEGTYIGMPVYGEVGPIVLDKIVEENVMMYLNNAVCDFRVNIEEICFESENKPSILPCLGLVSLNKSEKTIEVFISNGEEKGERIASCYYSDQFPSIEFIRQTMTSFELHLSATNIIKLYTDTSINRDVVATAIRMFGNEDLVDPTLEQDVKS